MIIVLYGRPYNRSDRVQWTLEELGVPYEYRKLEVFELEHRQPEFLEKYGLGRLPFVEIDGQVLFESGAIMLFLADAFRERIDLLPQHHDPAYRYVLQWLFFALSTLEASDEALEPGSGPAPFASLADTLAFLDMQLEGRTFITDERFTIADIALATGFKWFDAGRIQKYASVMKYLETHTRRPAFERIAKQREYP